ncbi:MAG: DUF2155 domain-containing protein [Yoonia sp.]|nr:DUF2155 domain-containing protein [Yoonia sp.]
MKTLTLSAAFCLVASGLFAQQASGANSGVLRVLDRLSGAVTDLPLNVGETGALGLLKITLDECRFPASNPNGDAYAKVTILYRDKEEPVFLGWLIASAPALNAMDHPRYDVWALRCNSA